MATSPGALKFRLRLDSVAAPACFGKTKSRTRSSPTRLLADIADLRSEVARLRADLTKS
jgi:hypothetical protein